MESGDDGRMNMKGRMKWNRYIMPTQGQACKQIEHELFEGLNTTPTNLGQRRPIRWEWITDSDEAIQFHPPLSQVKHSWRDELMAFHQCTCKGNSTGKVSDFQVLHAKYPLGKRGICCPCENGQNFVRTILTMQMNMNPVKLSRQTLDDKEKCSTQRILCTAMQAYTQTRTLHRPNFEWSIILLVWLCQKFVQLSSCLVSSFQWQVNEIWLKTVVNCCWTRKHTHTFSRMVVVRKQLFNFRVHANPRLESRGKVHTINLTIGSLNHWKWESRTTGLCWIMG